MDDNTIQLATSKNYTAFAEQVKTALKSKLNSHSVVSAYKDSLEKVEKFKQAFSDVANSGKSEDE